MRSALYDVFVRTMPVLINVIVGGLLAVYIIPKLQDKFEKAKIRDRRRIELMESVARNFPIYITSWKRLISFSEFEDATENVAEKISARKEQYIKARDIARDALLADLHIVPLYFDVEVSSDVDDYVRWDEGTSTLTIEQLPLVKEWANWNRKIVNRMRQAIGLKL